MPSVAGRRDLVAAVLGAAVVGLLIGVLGTFKHQVGVSAATAAGAPIGLTASLAMVAALLIALRLSFPSRWVTGAAAAGVVAAVGVLSFPGPGGAGVILANWAGITWTIGPAVIAAAVVGWPRLHGHAPAEPQPPDGILETGRPSAAPGGTLK